MEKVDDFKRDLQDLLAKYNADIYVDLNGDDLSGVSGEIVIDIDNKEVIRINELSQYDKI